MTMRTPSPRTSAALHAVGATWLVNEVQFRRYMAREHPRPAKKDGDKTHPLVILTVVMLAAIVAITPMMMVFGYPFLAVRGLLQVHPLLVLGGAIGLGAVALFLLRSRWWLLRAVGGVVAIVAVGVLVPGDRLAATGVAALVSVLCTAWLIVLVRYRRTLSKLDATYDPDAPRPGTSVGAARPRMVASPMAPRAAMSAPKGWYADPLDRHEWRYWDGASWSAYAADDGVLAHDPL